jgi:hypothetical protein
MDLTMTHIFLLGLLLGSACPALAQHQQSTNDADRAYLKVIRERAEKIVMTLNLQDSAKAARVKQIISDQYASLRKIHDAQTKPNSTQNDQPAVERRETAGAQPRSDLAKLHVQYLAKLSTELTPAQIDQVKDGMTYGVVQVTYKGYVSMLPELNEEQKLHIMALLVEAREIAMDAGSSEEKHQWFGKYKGKINNYLSKAGYDLKKASKPAAN